MKKRKWTPGETYKIDLDWNRRQAFEQANPTRYKREHLEVFMDTDGSDDLI